jgi:hypothetical protein
MPVFIPSSAAPPTTIAFQASTISVSTSIAFPAAILDGDLAVLWDVGTDADTVSTGFTRITTNALVQTIRAVLQYRICSSSDSSATVTNGFVTTKRSVLAVFRPDNPITSVNVGFVVGNNQQATTGDPGDQTAPGAAGTTPQVIIGCHGHQTTGVAASLASDTERPWSTDNSSLHYEVQNGTPTDRVMSSNDGGAFTLLASCALSVL